MNAPAAARPVRMRGAGALVLAVVSAVGIVGFVWPLFGSPAGAREAADLAHSADAPWLMLAVMPLLVAVLVAELTSGRLDAKAVALLGVLAAAGAALRMPTGGVAGLELVFFIIVLGGRVFGPAFGFVLGAVTLFASAILTAGVGPWLPFQMLAAGWVGLAAGVLPPARGRVELVLLALYCTAASYAFGLVMDLWFWPFGGTSYGGGLSFVPGDPVAANLRRFLAFHVATSLAWDTVRASALVTLTFVLGGPVLRALRRGATRAAFGAVPSFEAAAQVPYRGSA